MLKIKNKKGEVVAQLSDEDTEPQLVKKKRRKKKKKEEHEEEQKV